MAIPYYFIGVGGTGARVAESLVHLCAAGLGPDELFLMLIDPDEGNGNLSRTTALISKYQKIHGQISLRAKGVRLFRTRIVTPEPVVWKVFTQQNETLSSFIKLSSMEGQAGALKHFAEALFTEGDLDEKLNEGFRGRPAIGAVVLSQPNTEVAPWNQFWDEINKVNRADEAKVMVVGSIFGGTGAAGIPTLGAPAVLRDRAALDSEKSTSKIYLGACIILPYFSFSQNVPPEEKGRLFVRPDDFPLATSAALHYYLSKELAYEEMYLIGDSGAEVVGEFGAGSTGQKNRAHYVELGSALAALDFYERGARAPSREKQFFMVARNGQAVSWDGLPSARDKNLVGPLQNEIKFRLLAAAVFFYGSTTYGRQTLAQLAAPGSPPQPPWFSDHFKRRTGEERLDPCSAGQQEMIQRVEAFSELYLLWLRDLHLDSSVELMRMEAILDGAGHLLDWRTALLGQLAGQSSSQAKIEQFVSNCLNHDSFIGGNAGVTAADRYFNLFSLAADRFSQIYLNVQQPQS